MSKARRAAPQPTADLTYEQFARRVLGAWDRDVAEGDTCTTAKDAAGRAAFAATVGTKGRGTVLVTTPDTASAGAVLAFLKSFFADEPRLAELLRKQAGDTLQLAGGVSIVVTADPTRRPARLLAAIKLEPESALPENISDRNLARTLVALAAEKSNHPSVREAEKILKLEPGSLRALHQRLADRAREEDSAFMAAARAALPKLPSTSVPSIPRRPVADQPRGVDFWSPEHELYLAQHRDFRDANHRRPNVLRRKPR